MSEKSGEMPKEIQARMILDRHLWRGFSTDDDGGCTEKPDDVFEQGFEACYELMIEREAKLKAQLDLALSTFKNHALDCSEGTVCIYERLLDKLEDIK